RGLTCWISSRDIAPGDHFATAIVRAIRGCKVMVLIFTDNANRSGEITKELALASQNGLVVIPARVEDVIPSDALAYELATSQWVDVFRDWENAVERMARQIRAIAAIEADVRPAAPTPPKEELKPLPSADDTSDAPPTVPAPEPAPAPSPP